MPPGASPASPSGSGRFPPWLAPLGLAVIALLLLLVFTRRRRPCVVDCFDRVSEDEPRLLQKTNAAPLPASEARLVIGGCARDCVEHLGRNLERLDKICAAFRSARLVIYENDSKDGTLELLDARARTLHGGRPKLTVITEKEVKGKRCERLARGRNLVLRNALAGEEDFDYFLVLDLDEVIRGITPEAVLSCLDCKYNWGALASYPNWDAFALRTFANEECDTCCWACAHGGRLDTKAKCTDLRDCSRFDIANDPGLREVVSAFNGAALYRREYMGGCRYVGKAAPADRGSLCSCAHHEVCEHVCLHRGIRKNGGAVAVLKSFTIL
jgi:hypothetical protein